MLPNLRYLQVIRSCNISLKGSYLIVWQCNIHDALVLVPGASKMLIRLSLFGTYNSQGPYLLRAAVPGGVLLALRSLSIHRESGNSPKPREGHRWREDENGNVSQANVKTPRREFDGNYIMSISKAAPNLEELGLIGTSNDTLVSLLLFKFVQVVVQGRDTVSLQDSITASLSRFPKLQRLTLSVGFNNNPPFFERCYTWTEFSEFYGFHNAVPGRNYGLYAPESFDDAAQDLANGCRTLVVVTMGGRVGSFLIPHGLSARIIRECEGGLVKEVKRIRAWGNIIGREEEW
jgi:hypothetical protein